MNTESTQSSHERPTPEATAEAGLSLPTSHDNPPRGRVLRYDREFKILVVARLARGGITAKALASSLRVSPWVVYQWRRELGKDAAMLFPDSAAAAEQNQRLKAALQGFVSALALLHDLVGESKSGEVAASQFVPDGMLPKALGQMRLGDMFSETELAAFLREAQTKPA